MIINFILEWMASLFLGMFVFAGIVLILMRIFEGLFSLWGFLQEKYKDILEAIWHLAGILLGVWIIASITKSFLFPK